MKTPIEVKDIRKGDVIRCEFRVGRPDPGTAHATEYVAYENRHGWDGGQHDYFLVDRPTPPVELPTEPTLGWLDWYAGEESSGLGVQRTAFGTFERLDGGGAKRVDQSGYWPAGVIQAFTPAVAVPASALDELRSAFSNPRISSNVNRFLAAVDAANGDAS